MARKVYPKLAEVQADPSLIKPTPLDANPIDAWSFSRYSLYEQCPYKFKLMHIDKVDTPKPPAMARGNKVHKEAADYLLGRVVDIPESMQSRKDFLPVLRDMNPFVEQKWAYDEHWRATKYFEKTPGRAAWLRGSLDAGVMYPDRTFEAIDWKTGKKYGSNDEQMELFALLVMVRFPEVDKVMTRLSYVDMEPGPGSETYAEFSSADKDALIAKWTAAAQPMFRDTIFAPRQNSMCHFCEFNRSSGGPCRYG